jgi:hypothetical protein
VVEDRQHVAAHDMIEPPCAEASDVCGHRGHWIGDVRAHTPPIGEHATEMRDQTQQRESLGSPFGRYRGKDYALALAQ